MPYLPPLPSMAGRFPHSMAGSMKLWQKTMPMTPFRRITSRIMSSVRWRWPLMRARAEQWVAQMGPSPDLQGLPDGLVGHVGDVQDDPGLAHGPVESRGGSLDPPLGARCRGYRCCRRSERAPTTRSPAFHQNSTSSGSAMGSALSMDRTW